MTEMKNKNLVWHSNIRLELDLAEWVSTVVGYRRVMEINSRKLYRVFYPWPVIKLAECSKGGTERDPTGVRWGGVGNGEGQSFTGAVKSTSTMKIILL